MREQIEGLERRIAILERHNRELEQEHSAAMRELNWWQTAYRELKEQYDRRREIGT
jgi:chromosome segregation ATPase